MVADGNPSPTYQWQRDGSDIAGETSASLSIASTEIADTGSYAVVVSNSEGDVTSEAAVLVVAPNLFAPAITTQPIDVTVTEGETAEFSVVADGNPLPSYQWQRDGADIPEETDDTLQIVNVAALNAGIYTVVVSNSEGDVTSCLLYTSPSPRDLSTSRMPSSA